MTRRCALGCAVGAGFARGQSALPPLAELVNVWEIEQAAKQALGSALYASIAGGDRRSFDRMTFRPRLMVDLAKLDLSVDLFGEKHFAPLLVGPVAGLARFHAEGDAAMARGAKAAKAGVVLAVRPGVDTAVKAGGPAWAQVEPGADIASVADSANAAVSAGCKAVCLTVGAGEVRWDWASIAKFRAAVKAPLVIKGVMSPDDAKAAFDNGAGGVLVSNYRGASSVDVASAIDVLPSVVAAVSGKGPVLVDGGFRRGTDVLKALALGARAVLVARPAVWGLAAYGADGVRHAMELLQSELARAMVMCGVVNPGAARPEHVRVHRR